VAGEGKSSSYEDSELSKRQSDSELKDMFLSGFFSVLLIYD
jgi:hypothetical protein